MKFGMLLIAGLVFVATYNGIRTVYFAHENVVLTMQLQTLKQQRDKYNANWTQLLLEQEFLVNDKFVDDAIAQGLNLKVPPVKQVVFMEQ